MFQSFDRAKAGENKRAKNKPVRGVLHFKGNPIYRNAINGKSKRTGGIKSKQSLLRATDIYYEKAGT